MSILKKKESRNIYQLDTFYSNQIIKVDGIFYKLFCTFLSYFKQNLSPSFIFRETGN